MRSNVQKAIWISLSLTSTCAIVCALVLCYRYLELKLRVLFAQDQVRIFASMREKAHAGDIQCAMGCLEYTVAYYPTGTKQVESSPLNAIVETSRRLAIEDIIAVLRHKSKKDFGSDPEAWIKNCEMFAQETARPESSSAGEEKQEEKGHN